MQVVLGTMRRAIADYHMISSGDRIAVGLSGGKDSMILLEGLYQLRKYLELSFELVALTVDPGFGGTQGDYSEIEAYCQERKIPYIIKRSDLAEIIFEERKEKNPCSLCARMRRGMLHNLTVEQGCNKLAVGHHQDDAIETLLMNLFVEGRLGCFQPVTYLSRKDIFMIRPLILLTEKKIQRAVGKIQPPIVESRCPVDKNTAREEMKQWILKTEKEEFPVLRKNLFHALRSSQLEGWDQIDPSGHVPE